MKKILPFVFLLFVLVFNAVAQPTISSISALQGHPGSSISITGTNFNSTSSNNRVFFGATRATVTTASTTSLTVTVPQGATHKTVSVNNSSSALTGYSQYPFLPTYDNSTYIQGILSINPQVVFYAGGSPEGVAIGDLDGDGKPDLAVANYYSNTVSVFRNTSSMGTITTASFATQVTFATGTNPSSVAIGDIDGDGKPELVVANWIAGTISVYRNTSSSGAITTSSFAAQVAFVTGNQPFGITIADIDLDGKPEILTASYSTSSVSVLRNTSSSGAITASSFASHVSFTTGSVPYSTSVGDIDGDGKPDLAVANNGSNTVSVFRNTSTSGSITTGSFATHQTFASGTNPRSAVLADIDGDGKLDITVANYGSASVSILRNISSSGSITSGSFEMQDTFATNVNSRDIAIGDIDGDGKPEIAVTHFGTTTVSILRNTTTSGAITGGSFATPVILASGANPYNIAIGDLDGDSKPDIVVASSGADYLSVYKNIPLTSPPTISTISPLTGTSGTSVTISGTNFNSTPANNNIYFGATRATVTTASTTSLTTMVPPGATYKEVSVNNAVLGLTGYAQYPFLPIFDNSIYITGTVNFEERVDFTAGTNPNSVVIGDLDGDGKADMAVANLSSNTVSVYRNISSSGSIGSSSFAAAVNFATGGTPHSVAIGDIDGDGKPDLAVACWGINAVAILRNTSSPGSLTTASFAPQVTFASDNQPSFVAINDLDGDGKPDLAVTNAGSANVSILRNTGSSGSITAGSFAPKFSYTTGTYPYSLVVGDIDGDGKPDIAVVNGSSNSISVLRNTSIPGTFTSSSFASHISFATGTSPRSIAIGDIDGDGKPDLVVANNLSTSISILRNTSSMGAISTSSFATQVTFNTLSSSPFGIALGDIDGDGKPDITVAAATVFLFRNISTVGSINTSSLAALETIGSGSSPRSVAIGDLDGDGKPDIVYGNFIANTVSVIRNRPLLIPPTISNVSPNTANPGNSVTITGANFNTTSSNNIVYFGATRATVTAASTTSITATVPVGAMYKPVSVNNTSLALTGYAQQSFLPSYDNSLNIPGSTQFADKVTFATGSNPYNVSIGDIDGDGKPDLAVANYSSNTVSVFRNTSSSGAISASSFATHVTLATGTGPYGVAIGDIDGDGKLDLVVTNVSSNSVSVLRNTSSSGTINSGSFAPHVTFGVGNAPVYVAIGDLDRDGRPDLAVANNFANTLSVLRNTSIAGSITTGSFATQITFATQSSPICVAICDIDMDGKSELVATNEASSTVSVFHNTGSIGTISAGTFAPQVPFATGSFPKMLALGDINGDGKPDLVVANETDYSISLFRNTSTSGSITSASFATDVQYETSDSPFGIAISDIDGDNKPDIVASSGPYALVYRNTSSTGAFTSASLATPARYIAGSAEHSIAVGDIDGDSKPDIVLANAGSNTISVLRNKPLLVPPTITSVSPQAGNPGTSVTITGTNFNATTAGNIVFFGATRATVTAADTNSLTATVPAGATYLPVSVNNTNLELTANSQYPFLPVYDNTPYLSDTLNFSDKVDFTSGYLPRSVAIGDIDGDGRPDMVVVNNGINTISVYRNISTGPISSSSFDAPVSFATGSQPICVAIGDIDVDGKPDLVVANAGSNNVSVYRNTSTIGTINTGSFSAQVFFAAVSGPSGVAIGDLDRDGRPDIAVANGSHFYVSVLRNTSNSGSINSGSFATQISYFIGTNPNSIALGDLDGDGKMDIVATIGGSNIVAVLRNTSSIGTINSSSFAFRVNFATGSSPRNVAIGDLNGDGKQDLVVANGGGASLSVLRNTSSIGSITTGSFATHVTFVAGYAPECIAIADIDGDSKPDISVVNTGDATVSLFRNKISSGSISTSSFAAQQTFATGSGPHCLAAGDLDGDHKPDLVVGNITANTVSVLRNNPISTITGITSICISDTTTLTAPDSGGEWSSSNVSIATVGSTSGLVTGVAAGTAIITYTMSAGTTMTTLTVNGLPDAGTITGTATTCVSATSVLSNAIAGGVWSSTNTAVATIGSTGIVNGIAPGTSAISYTATSSCGSSSATIEFTVNTTPDAGTITGTTTLCTGGVTTLSNAASGGVWSSTNASIATIGTSGIVTGVGAGTATISYTVTNGCGSVAATTVVTVNATLTGVDDITGATAMCAGTTTTLANATADGVWSSSNTSAATVNSSGVVTGIAGGTAIISYTITNTCGSLSAMHTLTVNAAPVITGSIAMCIGQTSSLSTSPSGGTWNSSNTAVATVHASSGLLTGVGAGTAAITYSPGSGCNAQVTVTIGTAPAAFIGTMSACQGATSDLDHIDAGGTWSSSNPAKATINTSTGVVTAVSAGTATITYALSAGCYRAATFTIISNPGAIGGTAAMCEGAATALSCSPGGGTWSSTNTSVATISTTGVVSSLSAGTTSISYVAGTGCAATRVVTVNTLPDMITGTTLVCVGGTTTLGSAPGGGAWTSYFASRATVDATTGVVTGVSAGTTIISYTLAGGCRRTTIVTVAAAPAAITGSLALCVGSTTDLNCGTSGGTWSAATATVATVNSSTGLVSGIGTGTSIISYVTGSGCARTAVVTVSISGSTITGDALVCVGQTNATLSSGLSGGTWASSNTAIATVHAASGLLTGIGAGNANITYTRTPGCYNIIEATVNAAVGTITGATSVAAGATTTLTSSTGGGAWSSTNTLKATVNAATGEVTGVTAGTTTISYLVSTGCYRARTMVITATRPGISSEADAALTVLKVYPNPTAGRITVEAPVSGTFTVYTIEGRQVVHYPVSTAATTVSLPQNIARGLYLCRFNGEDGSTAMVRLVYQQ